MKVFQVESEGFRVINGTNTIEAHVVENGKQRFDLLMGYVQDWTDKDGQHSFKASIEGAVTSLAEVIARNEKNFKLVYKGELGKVEVTVKKSQ